MWFIMWSAGMRWSRLILHYLKCVSMLPNINMACLFVFPQWVGSPCGLHGPYIFYKAFRFHLEGKARILSLGDFFLVRCKAGEPVCIAELQLLWEERTSKQLLSSSKLYFLPEDTPRGRNVTHGEVISRFPAFHEGLRPSAMCLCGMDEIWAACGFASHLFRCLITRHLMHRV